MIQLGANINLVVCQKSKIDDWYEHFKEHYVVMVLNLTHKTSLACYIEWSSKWVEFEKPLIGIINYDLIWRRPQLLNLADFTLMLDESSLIQNEMAKRSKFILKLKPKNVILLSGTPVDGKYENLWSQIHLLGWNINKDLYWKQYIDFEWQDKNGFPMKVVKGYKNVERLKNKLREYGAQFLKTEEVLSLPEQIEQEIKLPTSKEYRKFRKNSIIEIDGELLVGETILTQMLYERQLCGQYSNAKLQAFRDLLESTNDRLIVFYNFNRELNVLSQIADEYERPISIVNGAQKSLENYETQNNSVTFVQYQAGAMGLNLQKANKVVYFTLPLGKGSCGLWEQSKKRTHRIGQSQTCFYYYLLCKGSIEERNLKMLKIGKELTDELFVEGE